MLHFRRASRKQRNSAIQASSSLGQRPTFFCNSCLALIQNIDTVLRQIKNLSGIFRINVHIRI
jgi:hypothetical protein